MSLHTKDVNHMFTHYVTQSSKKNDNILNMNIYRNINRYEDIYSVYNSAVDAKTAVSVKVSRLS